MSEDPATPTAAGATTPTAAVTTEEWRRHRLPREAEPLRYDLVLRPDLDHASFEGSCVIDLEVLETTNRIVCNAAELQVHEAWLEQPGGLRIDPELVAVDDELERLHVELAAAADPGRWRLHLRFTGVLNDRLRGFYRSTFHDDHGEEHVLATTQFEATDARRAFPCWDEPDRKAVFAVTLVVADGLCARSNAPERSRRRRSDGTVEVRFADTMAMSTYLVAFVVGPLELTDPVEAAGVELRVVHRPGQGHLSSYALEVASFCLEWFTEYYGIPYPGEKIDLVAIPDFAFGAMENLGCITFREVLLLVDPAQVTQQELQNVTDVIAHELAHMWFGDLVTMRWWNGIWLNEAFATFMEMAATDAFRPEWQRWASFGLSRSSALDVDALRSTRPVEYPVVSPDDAEGMFDVLTYEKGAAVLRMLEQFLGPQVFRDGVRRYLGEHAYGNTDTADLWDALEAASGEPVRRTADSWILQGGFPLVSATLSDGSLRLTQQHFRYRGDLGEGDPAAEAAQDAARWSVPVIFTQSGGGVTAFEKVLLEGESIDVPLLDEPLQWLLVNTEATGFYRVEHAPDLLEALLAHAHGSLSATERYALVDDAWAAVLAGRRRTHEYLELLGHFVAEDDLSVWQRIVGSLHSIDRLVGEPDARAAWQAAVRPLLDPAAARLDGGPDPAEGDRTRQLRAVLFAALGVLAADPAVRARARDLHHASLRDDAAVDPSLAAAAVEVIAASGSVEEFEDFLEHYRSAATPQEERRYLMALADFEDADLADRVLTMTLDGSIRSQDAPYVVRRALLNRTTGARAWAFVQAQWSAINERFPSNSIARMLEGVRGLIRPDVANLVFAFFETHEVPQGDRIVAQHLERLEVGLALRERDGDDLASHLRHR